MNILQKLHRWLTQRHQPAEVKTELSEPEANLKKAIQLMRDVQRTAKQWDDYYDDTMRWASTDDCHPLPRTDYENRRLAALAQKARDARMAWSAWMGEGLSRLVASGLRNSTSGRSDGLNWDGYWRKDRLL